MIENLSFVLIGLSAVVAALTFVGAHTTDSHAEHLEGGLHGRRWAPLGWLRDGDVSAGQLLQ